MSKYEQLHETAIKDVIDIISGLKDAIDSDIVIKKGVMGPGSIAKRASNLVVVFPVLVSSSLSIDTAVLISKSIERKCVSLLQILFASAQINNADNLADYINNFHKNLSFKSIGIDDLFTVADKLSEAGIIDITDKEAYEMVREDMKNINYYLSESFNPVSIKDYVVKKDYLNEDTVDVKHTKKDKTRYDTKEYLDVSSKGILSNDVKKANELMPTNMFVTFKCYDDKKAMVVGDVTGVIGVKAKLYPIDSMEIVNRLVSKSKDSNWLFNLIRATTREISFFKDFAFAIDKAKIDAKNMANNTDNAKIFKLLERRANSNKLLSLLRRNDASPISTLIISQTEVDYIKQYNIDLEKSFAARNILNGYNLMALVIADETLEIAKFMFDDGEDTFETLTFDSLERQNGDNSTKKIVNLLSKANR